jgi:hypothetical protein
MNNHEGLRKTARGFAIFAGTAAAGYGAYRIARARHSSAKEFEKQLNAWLVEQFEALQRTLDLGFEDAEWLHNEIKTTVHFAARLMQKAEHLKPSLRDLLSIVAEKKFLKMKLCIHKKLDLKVDVQLDMLHEFYRELWTRLFPAMKPAE